jgi:uncharacterized protein (DUF3820 family)
MQAPDPNVLLKLMKYKMPFGKYQDRLLLDIPVSYFEWFHQKGFPKGELGMMMHTAYEIKINGLEDLLNPLRR